MLPGLRVWYVTSTSWISGYINILEGQTLGSVKPGIAEGCNHTVNRLHHLSLESEASMVLWALIKEIVTSYIQTSKITWKSLF